MQSLKRLYWRSHQYIDDCLKLPSNIRHLADQKRDAGERNPFKTAHKAIYSSLQALNAECQDGLVRLGGVSYIVDPPRTIETLNEVLLRQDYGFSWSSGQYVVVDIGMNVGFASLTKANDPHVLHVYGFEPIAKTYQLAQRNFSMNPELESKISAFNFGLSDKDEQVEVRFCNNEIMSVSSEGTFDSCFWGEVSTEIIDLRRASEVISDIVRRHPGVPIFLKCDCEGAEFKIFRDLASHGLLDKLSIVVVEWHGQPPDPLVSVLTSAGFACFNQVINVEWKVGMIRAARAVQM